MKKIFALLLASVMVFALAACGDAPASSQESSAAASSEAVSSESEASVSEPAEEAPASVTIKTLNGNKEEVEIEVPYDPKRIAVMDLAVLDMIDNFGLGDRVVGVSKGSSIDYLQDYINNDNILNLGTIKEASMETVMECEPDVIFIGGRLAGSYEALSEIAPVVYLSTDITIGVVESTKKNTQTVASIFGVEDKATGLFEDFDTRIAALAAFAEGKTAFVGLLNAGSLNVLGNDGRCSLIGVEAGFNNVGLEVESTEKNDETGETTLTSPHGTETSFEFITRLNPDYIFVMNRDDAIGTEGAQAAKEVVENELIQKTDAYANGNIVYLAHSNVWYMAEGGITALDYMLKDLESQLLD